MITYKKHVDLFLSHDINSKATWPWLLIDFVQQVFDSVSAFLHLNATELPISIAAKACSCILYPLQTCQLRFIN